MYLQKHIYLQEVITHYNKAARISSTNTRHLQYPISLASSIFGIQHPQHPGNQFQYPITGIQLQRPVFSIQSTQHPKHPASSILSSILSSIRFPVSGNLSSSLKCWESVEKVGSVWWEDAFQKRTYIPPSSLNPVIPDCRYIIHLSVSGPWLVSYQSSIDRMWVCTAR